MVSKRHQRMQQGCGATGRWATRRVASWRTRWATSRLNSTKALCCPAVPSLSLLSNVSAPSLPPWLCPGRRFCLSPQLIIVACDQGQPAYETMQPLQVALDDIDDNEPIFFRPPVRHQGGHRGCWAGDTRGGARATGHHRGVHGGILPLLAFQSRKKSTHSSHAALTLPFLLPCSGRGTVPSTRCSPSLSTRGPAQWWAMSPGQWMQMRAPTPSSTTS